MTDTAPATAGIELTKTLEATEGTELLVSTSDGGRRDLALIILTGVVVVSVLASVVALALDGVVDAPAALAVIGGIGTIGGVALGRLTGRP